MNDTPTDGHLEEILAAYMEAADAGWAPDRAVLLERYPDLRGQLEAFFAAQERVKAVANCLTAPCDADATLAQGDRAPADEAALPRAFGDYDELEVIARGGMGVVFRARQKSLGRTVALKMVLSGQFASPADVQRFRNEAEAAALMDHPNIVPIYEIGEYQGRPDFSMKYIEGGNLAAALGAGRPPAGPRAAAKLVATMARAVHYAHQRGILHRDLKPANILLDEQGEPHVTDFGLAKRFGGDGGLTQSVAIVGTPNYMAPEQAGGGTAGLTTAADVHALGAILYELLTGRAPFRADDVLDTLLKVRQEKPVPPRSLNGAVDADLETICLKCLEKEPAQRYASAEALADDLERWRRGEPVRARRTGLPERTWKWARRRPGLALLVGCVTAFLLLSLSLGTAYAITTADLHEAETQRQAQEDRRQEAEKARATEERLRGEAEFALYVNRVMRAHFEWRDNAVARADQLLDECPQHLRDWEWRYVKRLCHADLLTLGGGSPHQLYSVCFSPDSKRLTVAGFDQTVKVWDAATGQETLSLRGHAGPVNSVCFSPDGRRLASASGDRTVKVWDAATGQEWLSLVGPVSGVCFSPDGQRLAGIVGGKVKMWVVATGQEVRGFQVPGNGISNVCFSPDGKRLAAGHSGSVKVWDAATGRDERTLRGHAGPVSGVCFSPDGKRLASASSDQTVKVWDAASEKEPAAVLPQALERLRDEPGGPGAITFKGHKGPVSGVCFSPDGKRLASASHDGTVKVWDATTNPEALALGGPTGFGAGVCFSPDGRRLAGPSDDGTVNVWFMPTGQLALKLRGHTDRVNGVCFSPDGRWLASASYDATVKVWDAANGEGKLTLRGHVGPARIVSFSPDGGRLASAGDDQVVRVWDLATGREVLALRGHANWISNVCFSPDGRWLASSGDITVKVWDLATGREALALRGHNGGMRGVCFSPDGKWLASGADDEVVKVWDAATGREKLTLRGHTNSVGGVCFSPDGRRIASSSFDQTVKVWDAATGQETLSLRGHTGFVHGVCFSPDGTLLASAGEDQGVKVWVAPPLPESREDQPAPPRS
jgi:WD40 repeat protein